ncbi:type III-B CRISPR module-associated protein Cmr5 [Chitinispirillales bacterium ANBcel5]|uniref:type III-B CRISPR module-associated protein Cmr5 n=1 Tax=Cellulosispirillum alkaliphilum TaxID=3039283 RepID=UPI002A51165F|nr:type III-B CRISPR module-associated protein Cmr5 [Chitinispirillales bacterium ANBcel5]
MVGATRSQKCAEIVFKRVELFVNDTNFDKLVKRRYKALCKRGGGLLRTVGLIQFLTFCESKGKRDKDKHYKVLLEHICEELCDSMNFQNADSAALLMSVRRQNLPNYMQTTKEVLRLLQWHKRIAEILIEGEDEDGNTIDKG